MATEPHGTESGADDTFQADRALWWRRLTGRAFYGVLLLATLLGVVSLVAIFALIGRDAVGPAAAAPEWYLVYFGTLVGPTAAYWLVVRERPAAKRVNARAFGVAGGGLALSLTVVVVLSAVGPRDAVIPFAFAAVAPVLVLGHARRYGASHLTGPAVPVSVLAGLAVGFAGHGALRPLLDPVAEWVFVYAVLAVPATGLLKLAADRRLSGRRGWAVAVVTLLAGAAAANAARALGEAPSLAVALTAGVLAPVGLLVVDTVENEPAGRVGLLGPVVLVGGVLAGAWIEARYGIRGVDAWITPTLLLESWSDFRPEQAGVYPQIVGSIMIVSIMALLAFPVGVGAAVYLEEYAPETGLRGRLATVLDVNISNLAGVPSVVYGLLGLALFRRVFGLSPGITVAAGATLALLILPIVIVSAQEALRSVPDELRQGSYGLGASRWQTVRNVVLPQALPGILTGTILALGRAIGETAPLVMIGVATTRFSPPDGLFSGATALPLQIFAAKGNNIPEYRTGVVAAAALVLLVLLLVMNATAILIRNHYQGGNG